MAIVPRAQRTVAPEPLPNVPREVSAPSQAFQGTPTPDLSPVVNAADRIAAVHKQRADQVAVLDADRQAGEFQQGLLNAQDGALSRQGKDVVSLPEDVGGAWKDFRDTTLSRLANDDQRVAAERMLNAREADINATVQTHVARELANYDTETTNASVALRQNDAVANYTDPAKVQGLVAQQHAIIADYGARSGAPPELIAQQQMAAASKTHVAVLQRLLDTGQDLAAQRYYATTQDQIAGEDRGPIERALERGSVDGEAQRQSDQILTKATTLESGLRGAATISDPRVRDATEKRVRQAFEDKAADERQREHSVYTQASQLVEQGKDVPPSLRSQMSAETNILIERRQDQMRRQAAGLGDSDPDLYLQLRNTAHASPALRQQFAHLNLLEFKSGLNTADYKALVREQNKALAENDRAMSSEEKAAQSAQADVARKANAMIAAVRANDSTAVVATGKPFTRGPVYDTAMKPVPGGPITHGPWEQFQTPPAPAPSPATVQQATRPGHPTVPETYLQHAQRDPKYRDYLTGMGILVPNGN